MGEMQSDAELLAEYAARQSEAAFARLVERHVALVHSAALRQVGDPHLAQEVTQAVFIILARKAGRLGGKTVLAGWLCRTAHLVARDALKLERRRQQREHTAYLESAMHQPDADTQAAWQQLAPLLDEAVAKLSDADRAALVLRYYEQRPLDEVGAALGVGADAAQKRVSRALEKLRKLFAKRGVKSTAALIASAIAANAVQAAPVGLAAAVVAAKGATASASLALIVKCALKTLGWLQMKNFAVAGLVLVTATVAVVVANLPQPSPALPQSVAQTTLEDTNVTPAVIREPLNGGTSFSLDSPPGALALLPDGKLIVGSTLFGWFVDTNSGALGYWSRGALRLNPDGSLDRTFLCDVGRHDSAAEMAHASTAPDGRVLVSGCFDAVDGVPRPGYALLRPDGSLDRDFQPWRGSNSVPGRTYLPGGTYPAALLTDGSVAFMCGSVEGRRTSHGLTAYRLAATGTWLPPAGLTVGGTFARPSGLIATLSGNGFSTRRAIVWTNNSPARPRPQVRYGYDLVELADSPAVQDIPFVQWTESPSASEAAVVLRSLFEEVPLELCRYAVRLPDGGVLLAVRDGPPMGPSRLMRFDRDWRPDFSFTNEFQAHPSSRLTLRRQPDGRILAAGILGQMNGEEVTGVVRLEPDGRKDHSFHCETPPGLGGRVMDLALQNDGRIVICGFFDQVNGVEVPHLARLNPDGSLDRTFRPQFQTFAQFNRSRFSNPRRIPVASLTKPAAVAGTAGAPETVVITSMQLEGKVAVIRFTGTPFQPYVLQARAALTAEQWISLSTNQCAANGNGLLRDSDASQYTMRFYRVARP